MKKSRTIFCLILLTLLLSCKNNSRVKEITSPEEFAARYCDCMKKNGSPKSFFYALTVCDGEFIQKNHLFRLYKTDLKYYETQKKITSFKTRDSVFFFARIVDSLTSNSCCELTANCHGDRK